MNLRTETCKFVVTTCIYLLYVNTFVSICPFRTTEVGSCEDFTTALSNSFLSFKVRLTMFKATEVDPKLWFRVVFPNL